MIIFYSNLKLYLYILKLLPNLFVVHQSQESLMIHESSNRQASIHQIWCVGTNEHVQYVHQLLHIWTWTVFVLNIWAMENSVVQVYKGSYCPIICWLKETVKEKGSLWNNQYNECQRFFSWLICLSRKLDIVPRDSLNLDRQFHWEKIGVFPWKCVYSRPFAGDDRCRTCPAASRMIQVHGPTWLQGLRLNQKTTTWGYSSLDTMASSWLREVSLWRMW